MITEKQKEVLIGMVGECEICRKKENLILHHIKRRCLGGKDIPRNLLVLCPDCHKTIHYNEPGMRKR
jgi:5-methylcytosine-specific restriction endonuclease McrA